MTKAIELSQLGGVLTTSSTAITVGRTIEIDEPNGNTATLTVQTQVTSGNDAVIKIRGARTGAPDNHIAMLQFDNKTSSAYTMATISARDFAGDHTLGDGSLLFRTSDNGTLSDSMTILSGGNVGIGTTNPSVELDVVGSVKASSQLISSVATGTAPLSVASTTVVNNLNADKLDGQEGSYYTNRVTTTTLTSTDNLNSLTNEGWYKWAADNPSNSPSDYGVMWMIKDASQLQQMVQTYGGNANSVRLYGRRKTSGNWDTTWTEYWSTVNDGAASGLNADKLDDLHAASFLRSDATTTFDCSGNDFQFDYDTSRTLIRISQLGTEKLRLSASSNTITLDSYNSGTLVIAANVSFSSVTTPITTNSIKFNNTEMSSTYYTNATGVLAFDENFSGDNTEYGNDAYAPAQVYSDDGGGLIIKNEDGWGAVLTSQNTRWATPTFEGIGVGQTASGCRNVLDLGSGTQNRGISWGGTNANYCNIWAEYSSGDLILGSGVRPTGTSTGFVSSYGGSSLGRSAIELQLSNGNINFFTATSSTIADGGSVSTDLSMLIEGAGNVGIGTNNPSSKLHVVGDITTTSGNLYLNDGTMSIGDNGGYEGVYWESENHAITYNDGTGNFNIRVGNNGITDEKCTEAGFIFQDEWSQSSGWRQFNISSASLAVGVAPTWRSQIEYDPNGVYLRYQGTTKLYTTASGVTVNGAVNPTSDIRLKENIQDIESPLDKVNSLRGVKFDWKSNGETDYGFIAQEVEQVIPEIVRTETLTENINKVHEETEVKTLSYQAIIGVLVEAVKELTSEVEALKSQISGS